MTAAKAARPTRTQIVLFAVAALATLAVPLSCRLFHPPPSDAVALAEKLRKKHPDWRVITAGNPERDGCYLCQPEFTGDIRNLYNMPAAVPSWKGVVLVVPDLSGTMQPKDIEATWGEHGLLWGEYLLIGDPQMLQEIAANLR